MAYVDVGEGEPVLFLHGNPTSSYLWRNIIPHCSGQARCIAPDLIGMGQSDKPDIPYRYADHYRYLEEFIQRMNLDNITLVVHDWGSGLGFNYAMRHPDTIRGIAFMEAILGPARWEHFPGEFKIAFKLFRTPGLGWLLLQVLNLFVEKVLPEAVVRDLTDAEMKHYRAPYPTVRSRQPVRQWPAEIPIEGTPEDVHEIVSNYRHWLTNSPHPKLLFYAHPGGLIRKQQVAWCREHLDNLETVDIGEGIHYLQEDAPHTIGRELAKWLEKID